MSATTTLGPGAVSGESLQDLDVVFVDLDAVRALLEREEASTPRLSVSDGLRIDRLSGDPARQALWRAARIATRIVLERAVGSDLRGAEFEIASGGRPSLGDGKPHFNVSHTANVALIAVCRSSPVGVDIECERRLSMSPERRRRIAVAAADLAGVEKIDPESDADVLRAWVRLEAIAKVRGTGIGILLTEEGVIGSATGVARPREEPSLSTAELEVEAPYIAAIAAGALPAVIAVERFPEQADALHEFLRNASTG